MSDLIDDPEPGQNAPEFTVSEISGVVKRMIEGEFSHVRIRGEVGRVSRPASGHLYLDLKDDRAVLASVIWKGTASRLRTMPEEGMEVIATGKLTTFPGQSRYQMVIEDIAPAGLGALMLMLERRKKALEAEQFEDAMAALATLRAPIDRFFEEVMVNDEDAAKRAFRLGLLARFRDAVTQVADFSKIEG